MGLDSPRAHVLPVTSWRFIRGDSNKVRFCVRMRDSVRERAREANRSCGRTETGRLQGTHTENREMEGEEKEEETGEGKKDKLKEGRQSHTEPQKLQVYSHIRFSKCPHIKMNRTGLFLQGFSQEGAEMFQLLGANQHPQPPFLTNPPLPLSP